MNPTPYTPKVLSASQAKTFDYLAEIIIPPEGPFNVPPEDIMLTEMIDDFLSGVSRLMKLCISGMLHSFMYFTAPFSLTPFHKMSPKQRQDYVRYRAETRSYARRIVFRAICSLMLNVYYSHPRVKEKVGYVPLH